MKGIFSILSFTFLIFFSLISIAKEDYQFDPNHTYILWHASHFGFSNPSGAWMANGTLILDENKPANSKVSITINMEDLTTPIPQFAQHLKEESFFDVAKFPTSTFISNKIDVTGKKTAKVQGILTIKGISKPVTLDVTLNKKGINPLTNKETLGFTAKTTIKRSDFGITAFLPNVSDKVKIDIEAEAFETKNS